MPDAVLDEVWLTHWGRAAQDRLPGHHRVVLVRAELLRQDGQLDLAVAAYDDALGTCPDGAERQHIIERRSSLPHGPGRKRVGTTRPCRSGSRAMRNPARSGSVLPDEGGHMADEVTTAPTPAELPRRARWRTTLPRRTRWLAEDLNRSWFTVPFLALVLLVVGLVPAARPAVGPEDEPMALLLLLYCTLLLTYPALTVLAFAGLSGERLVLALGESRRRNLARPTWIRRMVSWRDDDVGGDGPSWPVFLALGSLVVAVWLVVAGSDSAFFVGTSVVMIVLAWGGSLVAYAVHVARLDAVAGGLRFPGDTAEERAFSDYLYLALGVQAAFAPSDVQVTSRRMRRVLSGHMLVGWTFNTVVLAALVSFLVGLR